MSETYYIGWDVGAWHCKKNPNSRDAIVIINNDGKSIGTLWRGNLKESINESKTSFDFVNRLFELCNIKNIPLVEVKIVLAIDAPLGFSDALNKLLIGEYSDKMIEEYNNNQYLFRGTEIFLFEKGFSPLSSINHMIGSQTTKAMHVVAKLANDITSCGVWSDGNFLTIIETYPAACKSLKEDGNFINENKDVVDALICAKIAKMFDKNMDDLEQPQEGTSNKEGWIWVPRTDIPNTINKKIKCTIY